MQNKSCKTKRPRVAAQEREDLGFRNRSAAVVCPPELKLRTPARTKPLEWYVEFEFRVAQADLDDLIGAVFDGFEKLGVLDNTFVFFSSDNGYHLGEHKLVFGKGKR